MKSAGNRGVVHDRLQVLHVHVFLAAPLSTCHMAQPRADQHQGGVAIGECPHHAGPAADLTVQPLDHVVGADARPVLAGKIAVGQRLLNAVLDLLGSTLFPYTTLFRSDRKSTTSELQSDVVLFRSDRKSTRLNPVM